MGRTDHLDPLSCWYWRKQTYCFQLSSEKLKWQIILLINLHFWQNLQLFSNIFLSPLRRKADFLCCFDCFIVNLIERVHFGHSVVYRNDLDDCQSFVVAVIDRKDIASDLFPSPVCKSGRATFLSQISPTDRIMIHKLQQLSVFSHLCCISSGSFCFLLWSTGDWELMLRDGGVPSLICSLPPSGSVLPRSVFLHFALRFWNQTCIKKKEREREGKKWNERQLN